MIFFVKRRFLNSELGVKKTLANFESLPKCVRKTQACCLR
ncbi:hypothetical protein HMPREF9075_02597 [Capnocytophaga sp. oral taxon 332 str. F0381]|nr:hypothetical protein HMPREF9075_02597 [Capnocytophaga sp. oral taxon 332 str. F0381]